MFSFCFEMGSSLGVWKEEAENLLQFLVWLAPVIGWGSDGIAHV